jgi:DNA-binding CsgD family transcriptional regulator
MQSLGQAAGLIEKLIEQRRCGIVALSRHGNVMMVNEAAEATMRQRDGLSIENGHLTAARASTDRSLRALVAGILKHGPAEIPDSGGALAIPRPSGRIPFALRTVPCPRTDVGGWSELPAVLVLIADPDQRSLPGNDTLRALGLSAAETRIVQQIMQGRSLVEAASRIGVAHNTARAHLRNVFAKTHTRSQVELVSVLTEFSRIDEGLDRTPSR